MACHHGTRQSGTLVVVDRVELFISNINECLLKDGLRELWLNVCDACAVRLVIRFYDQTLTIDVS